MVIIIYSSYLPISLSPPIPYAQSPIPIPNPPCPIPNSQSSNYAPLLR
ncbi:MAG: hypothetical protein AAF630_13090 [Cyanobacteria bacterium P01_C01_bin.38]